MKYFLLPALAMALICAGCGKSYEANEAVKADLQRYLSVEVPRLAPVFRALNTASNAVKSGDQNQAMQMMQTVAVLDTALETVQSMQAGTPELQQIHAGLVEGWTALNSAISEVTRATDPQQMGPGTLLKLTRAMYSGLSATSEWREELEKIAAANGLQQECAAALQQLEPPAGQ